MKNKFLLLTLILVFSLINQSFAQYTLSNALSDVKSNADLSEISALIDQEISLSNKNFNTKWLPQLTLGAQATYQSETTGLPIDFPGINVEPLSKDQYKAQLELGQALYDGGAIAVSREMNKLNLEIENEDININLDQLEQKVIELYFSILEIRERKNIIALKLEEIAATKTKVESLVSYGVVLQSSLDELKIEEIKAKQGLVELNNIEANLIYTLSILTKVDIVDDTVFEIPQDISLNGSINEKLSSINKLNLQKQNILNADKLQASETLPKANLFAQAGYGRPGLNFLENDFSTYYIAGVNLKWNLSSFYNNSRNEEINSLKSQKVNALIENQRKLIETNIDQYKSQLKSVSTQMESDELIIKMAIDIKENAQYQLEQGALDMSEYIQKLNIEKEAFVNKSIHEIHEIKLKYIINHLSGNLK